MPDLTGRIAIVTGGTQGLGEAIAREFAQSGVKGIVTCGRSIERGQAVAAGIASRHGTPVEFVTADLSVVEDCRAVVARADEVFGRVDILVNAAAVTDRGTILDTSPELFDQIMATNVRGPFFLMQEATRLMIRENVEGSIVNIGSISALTGQPFISAYCTSKGALATLTRNSAFALLRNRIRVNQLDIGWMASDGEDRIQRAYHGAKDGWQHEAGAHLAYGRLLDPAEVARAVAFAASEEAGMMTGAVIPFDQSVHGGYPSYPPSPAARMEQRRAATRYDCRTAGSRAARVRAPLPGCAVQCRKSGDGRCTCPQQADG